MKTTISATLSKNSFGELTKYLEEYKKTIQQGSENAIQKITLAMYEAVKSYCYQNGIVNHTDTIKYEYIKETNTGKVYTNDNVIIFNEMGTGITGSNNPHPNPSPEFASWKYDVNEHGEKGWVYPKDDKTYAWTKGLPSRHMFYDAFNYIKPLIKPTISIEITKTTGDLY